MVSFDPKASTAYCHTSLLCISFILSSALLTSVLWSSISDSDSVGIFRFCFESEVVADFIHNRVLWDLQC